MTPSPHLHRRRGLTLLATALLAGAVIASTAGPAFADPSPVPTPAPSSGGTAGPAVAPGSITWAVQPSTKDGPDKRSAFTYTNIQPGTVINDYVGVTNFSDKAVTFDVYAADGFNTQSGSLGLLAASEKSKEVGDWVALPKKTITINPGERVNEPFTMTVPFNASPGDHVGGVIASIKTDVANGTNASVTVDRRLAVPVYLRVAGKVASSIAVESISTSYHGTVNPFGGGSADVSFTIHNTGNARIDLTSDIAVKGLFGIGLGSAHPAAVKDLLPGSTFRVTQRVSGVFPLGPLTAKIQLNPTEPAGLPPSASPPQATSGEAGDWAAPWPQLLLLILLAALVFGILRYMRRGRERTQKKVSKAVAKAKRQVVEELTGGVGATPATSGDGSG